MEATNIDRQQELHHLAIVMDGNGRWAEAQGLDRNAGHARGVEVIIDTILAAKERGIRYLSLFAFGQENWGRPESEVSGLISLGISALAKYLKFLVENKVRIRFIGDLVNIPKNLQIKIKFAQEATKKFSGIDVIVAFNYSGRWDITNAVAKLLADCADAKDTSFSDLQDKLVENLQTSSIPDPDLFIRTSGEQRISNFFLWQLSYTELYFTNICWPDFNATELDKALQEFSKRNRRFGKTTEQVENVKS